MSHNKWHVIYIDNDTNNKFNSFLHTFPNIFEYKSTHRNKNCWITQGIKISYDHKRRLNMHNRDSNEAVKKAFNIKLGKILTKGIQEAKSKNNMECNKTGDWGNSCNRADSLSSNK
jgi:hypothetical protein